MDQFKHKFINEANELLVKIENSLIDLEQNPENEESIHEVFRAMHTLKGTSVMFGFEKIGELTHFTESIFDKIREGEASLSRDIVEFTLESVDHIRNLLTDEKFVDPGNHANQDRLLRTIQQILKLTESGQIEKTPKKEKQKQDVTVATFYIAFEPDEKMLDRGISILSLFGELAAIGEYRVVNLTPYKEKTNEREVWGIYFVTEKGLNDILDIFIFVEENIKVVKLSDANLLDEKHFENQIDMLSRVDSNETAMKLTEEYTAARIRETAIDDIIEEDILSDEVQKSSLKDKVKKAAESSSVASNEKIEGSSRIQVDSSRLDMLMYLVSELVTTKARLRMVEETKNYSALSSVVEKVEDLAQQFRDNVLEIRLVPVVDMLTPFKRLIRDVSKKLDKKVNFITTGVETKLDKNIIDKLGDPLMHIIRNSIDHGIESPEARIKKGKPEEGVIKFSSYYAGSNVIIRIEDDGAGLNKEKIKAKAIQKGLIDEKTVLTDKDLFDLVFHPGFSTADKVTDVSGRGVGMDVVKRAIAEVRGEVSLESEEGKGTVTTIKLKQTISITDSLLLKVEDTCFLVQLSDVEFCDQKNYNELVRTNNTRVEVNGELLPYISIRDKFHTGGEHPDKAKLVVVHQENKKIALVVDKIVGEHQAVLKPLGDMFNNQEYLSGASVLGDGTLAIMIDTTLLINYVHENSLIA